MVPPRLSVACMLYYVTLSQQDRYSDLTWQATRAPLIVAGLCAYGAVSAGPRSAELRAGFPALARLICSAQPPVRSALAQLFREQLPSLLATAGV